MTDIRGRPPLVPVALAVAMLAVVLAAALGPATGTVAAAASCQYGTCPSSGPSALTWGIGALLAAVILIVALAVILQRRRGGPPSSGGSVTPWSGGAAESPAPAEAPPYMENPDDVGVAAAGAGAAAGAAAGSEPGDIDSLMGELDRISGEILKRGPGKKGPPTGDSEPESSSDS
ncbi:MAG: hypothetical protein L3K01_06395 [Thermoplasmata archaeon]|nr:hypothetical protein [Thermoplasmata archaeon]